MESDDKLWAKGKLPDLSKPGSQHREQSDWLSDVQARLTGRKAKDFGFIDPLHGGFSGEPTHENFAKLWTENRNLRREYESFRNRAKRLNDDTAQFMEALSLGLDPGEAPLRRYIPVHLYVAKSGEYGDKVKAQTSAVLFAFGFLPDEETPVEEGSMRWRPRFYSHEPLRLSDLDQRLVQLEKLVSLATTNMEAFAGKQSSPQSNELDALMKCLELARVRAETRQLSSEALANRVAVIHRLVTLLLSAAIGVSILIGTVKISKVEISPEKHEITVTRVAPAAALAEHIQSFPKAAANVEQSVTIPFAPESGEK